MVNFFMYLIKHCDFLNSSVDTFLLREKKCILIFEYAIFFSLYFHLEMEVCGTLKC